MSLEQVKAQIDKVAQSAGFRCVPVSWEDASRGTVGGTLSCLGSNISDVRLWEKSGKLLYTCRSQNWNERLGYVAAKDVAVVVGNHVPGGSTLGNVTLQDYLTNASQYGGYAGLATPSLSENQMDQIFSIRFQTVFLPVEGDASPNAEDIPPEKLGRVEFCTDVYNYNTHSDENPRNILLLCTAQGTSMQQDGAGTKKVFLHETDPLGTVHRYWLEAERSKHKVGGAQKETKEEAEDAAARGKAVATFIGTRAMGTRFNVQMLIQLPVKQEQVKGRAYDGGEDDDDGSAMSSDSESFVVCEKEAAPKFMTKCKKASKPVFSSLGGGRGGRGGGRGGVRRSREEEEPKVGISSAARVSRASEEDTWNGLTKKDAQRDINQHGTITVTMYYTVVGGIPSEPDVLAAIADLDQLYKACPSDKKLAECTEITSELTVKNVQDIVTKVTTQGYQPPVKASPTNNKFPAEK